MGRHCFWIAPKKHTIIKNVFCCFRHRNDSKFYSDQTMNYVTIKRLFTKSISRYVFDFYKNQVHFLIRSCYINQFQTKTKKKPKLFYTYFSTRVSVQGVKSLGGQFACLCQGFEFYEVKKILLLFFKKKMEILLHF